MRSDGAAHGLPPLRSVTALRPWRVPLSTTPLGPLGCKPPYRAHYFRRQLSANVAIASSRVAAYSTTAGRVKLIHTSHGRTIDLSSRGAGPEKSHSDR